MRLATSPAAPVTGNSTKVISATPKLRGASMISTATTSLATPQSAHFNVSPVLPLPTKLSAEPAMPPVPPVPVNFTEPTHEPLPRLTPVAQPPAAAKPMSCSHLPATARLPSPSSRRKSMIPPAQRASYSDDEYKDAIETENVKQRRRQSKNDAWADILDSDRTRMLGDQDAKRRMRPFRPGYRKYGSRSGSRGCQESIAIATYDHGLDQHA